MKKRRFKNEINAGSMADIAFLLLIFFLVTTTIVVDKGIAVKLPPWEEDPISTPLPDNNVFTVKVNAQNELLIEGEYSKLEEIRARAKEFIMNPQKRDDLPDKPTKAVISIQNDRGTEYETYVNVYNEIRAAYNELWQEAAQKRFGKDYESLTEQQQKNIRKGIPLVISEAEPTEF